MSGFALTPLEGYQPPGVESFDLPPLIPGVEWANKFLLQAVLSVAIILVFWIVMARKRAMVPSRGQFVGEYAYMFVRNSIGRDVIGHDFKRWVPLLIALFSFVLVNNLWGVCLISILILIKPVLSWYGVGIYSHQSILMVSKPPNLLTSKL